MRYRKNTDALWHTKMKTFDPYGKLNIAFSRDFSQLEPVGCAPLYKEKRCAKFYQHINYILYRIKQSS